MQEIEIERVWDPEIAPQPLTPRQTQVLDLLKKGVKPVDIANNHLYLTPKYVYGILAKIREKYCVNNTLQLFARIREEEEKKKQKEATAN